jgi:hypothetical protein
MSNLVKDLLPDDQQIARLLVVAAEQQIPGALQDHVSHGMDVGTATRLVASSFAASTLFAQQACTWVVSELAVALGLSSGADLDAVQVPASESVNSGRPLLEQVHTVPAAEAVPSALSGTAPGQRRGSGPGSSELPTAGPPPSGAAGMGANRRTLGNSARETPGRTWPAPHTALSGRSRLAIAAIAVLAVLAGVIVLLNQHGTGSPLSSPAVPQGTHSVNRKITQHGSLIVALTTISVKGDRMTVDVTYRNNAASTPVILSCTGYSDPSIVTVSLADGTLLHASKTSCSADPAALFTIGPKAVHHSYATFTVSGKFAQPFTFHWPYGSLRGSVSGIRI